MNETWDIVLCVLVEVSVLKTQHRSTFQEEHSKVLKKKTTMRKKLDHMSGKMMEREKRRNCSNLYEVKDKLSSSRNLKACVL